MYITYTCHRSLEEMEVSCMVPSREISPNSSKHSESGSKQGPRGGGAGTSAPGPGHDVCELALCLRVDTWGPE